MKNRPIRTPELLAPAGSPAALEAAVAAGADAVYLGGKGFNARTGAQNFDTDALAEAVALCHAHGVKVYVTLNTLLYDRELSEVLRYTEFLYRCGAGALIIADLGLSALVRKYLPDLPLHASTQMSVHNSDAGRLLKALGFSRMVCARELSCADIAHIAESAPIETEVFVHGALCVSHSGQCLASALIGGRSGNRGECAQPCRLPWRGAEVDGKKPGGYALSLRDLCLAGHMAALLKTGVSSLKIEGRMKSPEYVYHVVATYRRLLNEGRDATPEEIRSLARVFSREGFTDRYFAGKPDRSMLGVRTEQNKQASREIAPFEGLVRKVPLSMAVTLSAGEPALLRAEAPNRSVEVSGDIPEFATNAPLTGEAVARSLSKLGQTPFFADESRIKVTLRGNPILRVASLNALRRSAVAALLKPDESRTNFRLPAFAESDLFPPNAGKKPILRRTARFLSHTQIPPEASGYFDLIFLPLEAFLAAPDKPCTGVILPEVIFDSERKAVAEMLAAAVKKGAAHALVGNLGHLALARQFPLVCHGDFRLNILNSLSAKGALDLGFADLMLSPELALPQIRDIPGPKATVVYGRIPLMLLEKCVIRDSAGCEVCNSGGFALEDRRGVRFPVARTFEHRNLLFNSVPVYMADRADLLEKYNVGTHHYLFSVETKAECRAVIEAYQKGLPPQAGPVRRLHS